MRRRDGGTGCGARGRSETHASRSGGAGAPPGGTRTPRQELADGACSCLAEARKSPMLRKGSDTAGSRADEKAAESAARPP
jgi:hypothetical protein